MKAEFALVRLQGLNNKPQGQRSIAAALLHNKRELSDFDTADRAEAAKRNFVLLNAPATRQETKARAVQCISDWGFSPRRRDAVVAVEALFSVRDSEDVGDVARYFTECSQWLMARFEGTLLCADVHLDESVPHCHAIVMLPIAQDGPPGSKIIGDRRRLSEHVADFFGKVASRYGLKVPPPKLSRAESRAAAREVHAFLSTTDDPVRRSVLWPFVVERIDRAPLDAARHLPISGTMPSALAVLAASSGSGPRTEAAQARDDSRLQQTWFLSERDRPNPAYTRLNTIDVADQPAANQHLPCVDVEVNVAVRKDIECSLDHSQKGKEDVEVAPLSQQWDPDTGEWIGEEPYRPIHESTGGVV